MRIFASTRSVIMPPVAKSVKCLTYILFSTFVENINGHLCFFSLKTIFSDLKLKLPFQPFIDT